MPERGLRAGGAAGLLGVILVAVALATLPTLPGADAGEGEVFAFFLDAGSDISVAAALLAVGSLLLVVLFATVRARVGRAASGPAGTTMLAMGAIAAGGQAFYAATLATLAIRSEDAEPATARALLDLADLVAAFSDVAFALALIAAGIAIRRSDGVLPKRLGDLALIAALGTGLWIGRLFAETGLLAADGFLGSTLGSLLLLMWAAATSLWLVTEELEASVPTAVD